MMMLGHPPLLIFQCPVKMKMKKSNPTMFGNMPLISYLNILHFTLIGKPQKMGQTSNMDDMEQFYQWAVIGELSTSDIENSWDKSHPEFLKTNPIKNLHMLWKYLHHLVQEAPESSIPGNPFSIFRIKFSWSNIHTKRTSKK